MNIVETLEKQSEEIAKEGHNGWGNTMIIAAETINRLEEALQFWRTYGRADSPGYRPADSPVCEHGKQMSEGCTEGKCDRGRWVS